MACGHNGVWSKLHKVTMACDICSQSLMVTIAISGHNVMWLQKHVVTMACPCPNTRGAFHLGIPEKHALSESVSDVKNKMTCQTKRVVRPINSRSGCYRKIAKDCKLGYNQSTVFGKLLEYF